MANGLISGDSCYQGFSVFALLERQMLALSAGDRGV
jgi:hypothetical protein